MHANDHCSLCVTCSRGKGKGRGSSVDKTSVSIGLVELPEELNSFTVTKHLGTGASAVVYGARSLAGEEVAVKVITRMGLDDFEGLKCEIGTLLLLQVAKCLLEEYLFCSSRPSSNANNVLYIYHPFRYTHRYIAETLTRVDRQPAPACDQERCHVPGS